MTPVFDVVTSKTGVISTGVRDPVTGAMGSATVLVMDRTDHLELAASQHGAVTRAQLIELGWSYGQIDWLVRSGQWERVTSTVLRRVGSADTNRRAAVEAVLDAGPRALLSHFSAGRIWGLKGCSLRPFQAVRSATTTRVSTLASVRRVERLPQRWLTNLDGIPIVRPELLAMQLFDVCSPERASTLTDRLWSYRLLSGRSIDALLEEFGCRGRNGTAGLRAYFEIRGIDYIPPASGLESRAMQLLEEAGIPMERQVDTGDDDRWIGRVDFRHPTLPLVLEIQSELHHSALVDKEADEARIKALRAAGFVVCEVTDDTVWSRPAEFIAEVRDGVERARRLRR